MSSSESDIESDISSFAAWENTHKQKIPSERERSIADMADTERVWGGVDSSNDARSSSSSSDSDGENVVPKLSGKVGKGGKGLGMGKGGQKWRGKMEIPSSTADEDSQSQRRLLSAPTPRIIEVSNCVANCLRSVLTRTV
jgi:hypothetical protein